MGLRELCLQQIEQFKAAAEEKNIRLDFNQHFDGMPLVFADGLRLRQMLSNLLSNALKFTATGSIALDVRASALEIVSGLARQMGGSVGATSVVGQGSCFWFTAAFEKLADA